jgi:hypothetical protein
MTVCGVCPALPRDCTDRECGDDGAGGSCGSTPDNHLCLNGQLVETAYQRGPKPLAGRPAPGFTTAEVGTLQGSFSVSHAGDANYSVPLPLPQGRGGLSPGLALSYSSTRGNGFLGAGWALAGMEAITRCDRSIAQDGYVDTIHFDQSDAFCLNGERLVPQFSGFNDEVTYYAFENNDFSSIKSYNVWPTGSGMSGPKYFEVTTRDGMVKTYGGNDYGFSAALDTASSRILGPAAVIDGVFAPSSVVQTWALSKFADRHGNYAALWYDQARIQPTSYLSTVLGVVSDFTRREYYPSGMLYSMHDNPGDATTSFPAQAWVMFQYDDSRTDPLDLWRSGMNMQTNRLLNRIEVVSLLDGSSRSFKLSYDDGGGSPAQNRLTSIQHCARREWRIVGSSPESCTPATSFSYERDGGLRPAQELWASTVGTANADLETVLDFDGDGRDDLLWNVVDGKKIGSPDTRVGARDVRGVREAG